MTSTPLPDVVAWRRNAADAGTEVAWTNGCFDLFHLGHLRNLEACAGFAEALIVGLNSDVSVRRLKGEGRPLVPFEERAAILAALRCVDLVVVMFEDEPSSMIREIRPDVVCKGADYGDGVRPMPERAAAAEVGARLEFVPLVSGLSTSIRVAELRRQLAGD